MAYKFQVGSSKLSGSITLTNILSSSAQMSASAFFGDGSGLSGIAATNAAVTDKGDDTEYNLVAVAAAGSSVTLITDDTALTKATFNPSVGRLTLAGSVTTNALTASSGFMIGTTAVTATGAELNYLDITAAGTAEASKAVVTDGSNDIAGFNVLSGSTLEASTKIKIGSAELVESELETLDGITAGTVAASKAVVVDASKDISGFNDLIGEHLSGSTVEASTKLVIGSADITEAELEQIDGITAGTVAASKAVVVDASKDVSGFRNLTGTTISGSTIAASTKIMIGSADITEAELELIDGITAGTVAASKAVVADSNKDVTGFRNVTATGTVTSPTVSGSALQASTKIVIGSAELIESELEMLDGITAGTAAANKAVVLDADKNIGTLGHLSASVVSGSTLYGDGSNLSGIAADHIDVTAGSSNEASPILFAASGSVGGTDVQPLGMQPAGDSSQQFTFNPGNGNLFVPGNVEAAQGASFVIGSADLNEADMEQIDGITAGTVAASKAVVVDSNKDAAGFRNLTATTVSGSHIQASEDIIMSEKRILYFAGDGSAISIRAQASNTLNLNGATAIFNGNVHPDATLGSSLGSASKVWYDGHIHHLTASIGATLSGTLNMAAGKKIAFGGNGEIDFSNASTGQAYLQFADNLGEAFFFAEGANTYMTFVTTDNEEGIKIGKDFVIGSGVATGDEPVLELYGAMSQIGQFTVKDNIDLSDIMYTHYLMSGTGSTKLTVTLPAAETGYSATFKRHPSMTASCGIIGNGGETIDGSASELLLETAGASVQLVASGSSWFIY